MKFLLLVNFRAMGKGELKTKCQLHNCNNQLKHLLYAYSYVAIPTTYSILSIMIYHNNNKIGCR